jgi:hypothetical protein
MTSARGHGDFIPHLVSSLMEVVILSSVRHAKYTMPIDHENIRYPYNSSLEGSIAYMTPALTSYGLDIAIAT